MRQRLDLDFQGREGLHKATTEFYTPVDIVAQVNGSDIPAVTLGMIWYLNDAFDDAYVYDPINHSAPQDCSAYIIPTASGGNPGCTPPRGSTSIHMFEDLWQYFLAPGTINAGNNRWEAQDCMVCADSVGHTFAGPASGEPRLASQRGGFFLKSRLPAAAGPSDKFGFGVITAQSPRGNWQSIEWLKWRSPTCTNWSLDYQIVHPYTNAWTEVSLLFSRTGPAGGIATWPAGTFSAVDYLVTDTFANFQGHVDWLEFQGLI
jgi:hypothetical protein